MPHLGGAARTISGHPLADLSCANVGAAQANTIVCIMFHNTSKAMADVMRQRDGAE